VYIDIWCRLLRTEVSKTPRCCRLFRRRASWGLGCFTSIRPSTCWPCKFCHFTPYGINCLIRHRNRFGIVPSNSTTYTLSQLQDAIKSQTGSVPFFGCTTNGTVLSEVWYFSHVHGTVRLLNCILGEGTECLISLHRNNSAHIRLWTRPQRQAVQL
jgi:hypothetical protein